MEISGVITKILDLKTGVSKITGNPWMSQQYVIETKEPKSHQLMFEVVGEDKIKSMNILLGEELTVFFEIDAREYNGRWFNMVKAWKVERGSSPNIDIPENVLVHSSHFVTDTSSTTWTDLPFESNDILPF